MKRTGSIDQPQICSERSSELLLPNLMRDLLPLTVVVVDWIGEPCTKSAFAEERAQLVRASPARRAEFLGVRNCARQALSELGVSPTPILRGGRGTPVWPHGIVGSMTHCLGYLCAAVADAEYVQAVGIDAEQHRPLHPSILSLVATGEEKEHLSALAITHPELNWDCIMFSAKESVYKAWFPVMQTWLDFLDVRVTFFPDEAGFRASFLSTSLIVGSTRYEAVEGTFAVRQKIVLTSVVISSVQSRHRTTHTNPGRQPYSHPGPHAWHPSPAPTREAPGIPQPLSSAKERA